MGLIKVKHPPVSAKALTSPPADALPPAPQTAPQTAPPPESSDTLSATLVRGFFKEWSALENAIAEQNALKRDLLTKYRKEHGPERTNALKLACSRALADPDKLAKREALNKEAEGYLAMLQ